MVSKYTLPYHFLRTNIPCVDKSINMANLSGHVSLLYLTLNPIQSKIPARLCTPYLFSSPIMLAPTRVWDILANRNDPHHSSLENPDLSQSRHRSQQSDISIPEGKKMGRGSFERTNLLSEWLPLYQSKISSRPGKQRRRPTHRSDNGEEKKFHIFR